MLTLCISYSWLASYLLHDFNVLIVCKYMVKRSLVLLSKDSYMLVDVFDHIYLKCIKYFAKAICIIFVRFVSPGPNLN